MAKSQASPGTFDGGVYDANGQVVTRGLQLKASYNNEPLPWEEGTIVSTIAGTHLFGGMLQARHFGHFLTESLSRMWAFKALQNSVQSVVFYLRDITEDVEPWVNETFREFFPEANLTLVRAETRFETLIVPDQSIHPDYKQIVGTPLIRQAFSQAKFPYRGTRRDVYISRSKLHVRDGGILGETHIEQMLQRDGYDIIYPERLTIEQQVQLYRTSGRTIFAEGSAIHLFALCATPTHRPFIIWRRRVNGVFQDQLRSFTGKDLPGSARVKELWIASKRGSDPVTARASVDMHGIEGDLRVNGFISDQPWDEYDTKRDDEELRELGKLRNDPYLPHPV
ncbi:glycosyltransferase family 61 protein [Tianweitania sediminis]|uniref:Glycosyltransferase family 61 protein n=1 Tax=Tianweitania sediminis TaxID=1502156 RepID=A0A8J7R7J4_9HYPH|nr:glycosyltransferase 61 family protein [Tianweitania sediminis]MBP0439572.1 glycosyltransferase family 61 protein [Tianweitania sediminis]